MTPSFLHRKTISNELNSCFLAESVEQFMLVPVVGFRIQVKTDLKCRFSKKQLTVVRWIVNLSRPVMSLVDNLFYGCTLSWKAMPS